MNGAAGGWLAAGLLCLGYYVLIAVYAGPDADFGWFWIALGAAFLLAAEETDSRYHTRICSRLSFTESMCPFCARGFSHWQASVFPFFRACICLIRKA